MPWLQLIIDTDPEHVDALSDALMEQGAHAVTLQDAADQPLFEPAPGEVPLWSNTRVVALLDATANTQALDDILRQQFSAAAIQHLRVEPLEDKDWVRAWMDHFEPMQFGQRLWIVPSGFDIPDADGVNIKLDPGLAFGTGTHPTTAMCLRWLDAHPPVALNVIDYGCGSGILSLAASLLGATQVCAVDTDPQALLASSENARRNHIEQLNCVLPDDLHSPPVDLLLANILAGPLHELAAHFAQLVKPGGQLVLSGILQQQAAALIEAYATHFDLAVDQQQEEWVCLSGTRH